MLYGAMNREISCSSRSNFVRFFATPWTCIIKKIVSYLGWPLLWILDLLASTITPVEQDLCTSCQEIERHQIVRPILIQLFFEDTDFSYPEGSNLLITNVQTDQMSATWFIAFLDDHCQEANDGCYKQENKDFYIDYMTSLRTCKQMIAPSCKVQHHDRSRSLLKMSQFAEDNSTHHDSEDSGSLCEDSDYSDMESNDELDADTESCDELDCDSFFSHESDEDISVVFSEDCDNLDNNQCEFQFASNILIEFQPFGGRSMVLEDIPNICLHELYSSDSYACHEKALISQANYEKKNLLKASCIVDESKSDESKDAGAVNVRLENKESRNKKKTVGFVADEELVTVHPMIAWSFAYQAARKGHWENYAVDRAHFQRKIQQIAENLEPVLRKQYQIYKESC